MCHEQSLVVLLLVPLLVLSLSAAHYFTNGLPWGGQVHRQQLCIQPKLHASLRAIRALCHNMTLSANGSTRHAGNLLLFGDSVDRKLVETVCEYLGRCGNYTLTSLSDNWKNKIYGRNKLHLCESPYFNIGFFHIPGIHLSGPFFENLTGNAVVRVSAALQRYKEWHSEQPAVIALSSNIWDAARLATVERQKVLSAAGWTKNFSRVISHIASESPQALLIYHTTPIPKQWPVLVERMNALGAKFAKKRGWVVIDMAAMVGQFSDYLEDPIHPIKVLHLDVANLLLNYL